MKGNNTPRTETVTVPAGATIHLPIPGKWMQVMSCTVASFQFAFDNDPLTAGEPFVSYPCAEGFDQIRFRDSLGAGCTIVVQIADTLPQDNRGNRDQLIAIAASVAAIDIDTSGIRTDVQAGTTEMQTGHLHNLDTVSVPAVTTELQTGHLHNLDGYLVTPTDGEAGQVALTASGGATPHANPGDHACRAVMFWTEQTQVYLRVTTGGSASDNTRFKMKDGITYTIEISNTNKVDFYNADAAAGATIYYQYLT